MSTANTEKLITIKTEQNEEFQISESTWDKFLVAASEQLSAQEGSDALDPAVRDSLIGALAKARAINRYREILARRVKEQEDAAKLKDLAAKMHQSSPSDAELRNRVVKGVLAPEPSLLKSAAIHLAASFGISLLFFGTLRAAGAIEKK